MRAVLGSILIAFLASCGSPPGAHPPAGGGQAGGGGSGGADGQGGTGTGGSAGSGGLGGTGGDAGNGPGGSGGYGGSGGSGGSGGAGGSGGSGICLSAPASIDLGSVVAFNGDGPSSSRSFAVQNDCHHSVIIRPDSQDLSPFSTDLSMVLQSVPAHGTVDVKVTFKPLVPGPAKKTLNLSGTDGEKLAVELLGNGATAFVTCAPDTLTLTSKMQSADITCTDHTSDPAHLTFSFEGGQVGRFWATPTALDLDPLSSKAFTVSFQPAGDLAFVVTLNVSAGEAVPIASILVTGYSSPNP